MSKKGLERKRMITLLRKINQRKKERKKEQ